MDLFNIEARFQAAYSVLFPEQVTKVRHIWGQTTVGTTGVWHKYRLVIGDLAKLWTRIQAVAQGWSVTRKKNPVIDTHKLFEESNTFRTTGVDIWDYSGRIDTVSREAILAYFRNGQRVGLKRDSGYGFRGIAMRAEEPMSIESYAANQLKRLRAAYLNRGQGLPEASILQPWILRQAAESDLRRLLALAYHEYTNDQTLENLQKVIELERIVRDRIVHAMRWAQLSSSWDHFEPISFPDRGIALRLWEQNLLDNLIHDDTDLWWQDAPPDKGTTVRMVRGAYMSNGRVNITIKTVPQINTLEHPTVNAAHHLLTYGPPPYTGVAIPNPNVGRRWDEPFVGRDGQEAWQGVRGTAPEWRYLKSSDASIPEPSLTVRTRPVAVEKHLAETLEAALAGDRPTLVYVPFNGATAPILALPRTFLQTYIIPLFAGGIDLKPTEEHNKIEGWVTRDAGYPKVANLIGTPPLGFLPAESSARPLREGAVQELLPFA